MAQSLSNFGRYLKSLDIMIWPLSQGQGRNILKTCLGLYVYVCTLTYFQRETAKSINIIGCIKDRALNSHTAIGSENPLFKPWWT